MRVLLTTDTIGGVWTFTKELTAELLRLGHSVALVSFGRAPSQEQADWCSALAVRYGSGFRYEASTAPLEWMNPNEDAYQDGEIVVRRLADDSVPTSCTAINSASVVCLFRFRGSSPPIAMCSAGARLVARGVLNPRLG